MIKDNNKIISTKEDKKMKYEKINKMLIVANGTYFLTFYVNNYSNKYFVNTENALNASFRQFFCLFIVSFALQIYFMMLYVLVFSPAKSSILLLVFYFLALLRHSCSLCLRITRVLLSLILTFFAE